MYEVSRRVIDEAARRASTVAIIGVGGMVPGWRLPSRGLIFVANWLIVVGVASLLFSRFAVGVMESGVEPSALPSFEWVGVAGLGVGVAGVIVYCSIALPIVRWSLLVVSIIGLTAAALIYGRASGDVREWARAVGVLLTLAFVALLLTCMLRIATMSQFVVESVRRGGSRRHSGSSEGCSCWSEPPCSGPPAWIATKSGASGPRASSHAALDRPPTDGPNLFDELGFLLVAAGAAAILNLFGTRREDGLLTGTERLNLFLASLPSEGAAELFDEAAKVCRSARRRTAVPGPVAEAR